MILFALYLGIGLERVGRKLARLGNALVLWSAKESARAD